MNGMLTILTTLQFFSGVSLLSSKWNEFLSLLMKISDVFFLRQSLDQNVIYIHLILKLQMPAFLVSTYLKHNVEEIRVACNEDL